MSNGTMSPKDALAVIARHRDAHESLSLYDAYSAQEYPRLRAAHAAVAELIADMRRIKRAAELGIKHHSVGPGYTEEILATATAALARVGGAK